MSDLLKLVDDDGCVCGDPVPCCANPDVFLGHDEFCDCDDDHCDYQWYSGCRSCGGMCGCNV